MEYKVPLQTKFHDLPVCTAGVFKWGLMGQIQPTKDCEMAREGVLKR